jgi:hypothetical protein
VLLHMLASMPVHAHACHGGGSEVGASGVARERVHGCAGHLRAGHSLGELALDFDEPMFSSGTFAMLQARAGVQLADDSSRRPSMAMGVVP